MKLRTRNWTDDLWHANFSAIRGSWKDATKLLGRRCPWLRGSELLKVVEEDTKAACTFVSDGADHVVIWLGPQADASAVAHEAVHGALAVLRARGLKVGNEAAEEAVCYMVGWIVERLGGL